MPRNRREGNEKEPEVQSSPPSSCTQSHPSSPTFSLYGSAPPAPQAFLCKWQSTLFRGQASTDHYFPHWLPSTVISASEASQKPQASGLL